MEWYKILGLCLSCFSLGISLTGLVFSTLEYRRSAQKLARMDAQDDDNTAKWELVSHTSDKPYKCSRCGHRVGAELPGKCPACKRKITGVV